MIGTLAERPRLTLACVGEDWEAVRMRAAVAAQVTAAIGEDCGSVITDGLQAWFFVRPGAGRDLNLPGVTVCLPGSQLLIPAADVTTPPGMHWSRVAVQPITPAGLLRRAVEGATR